MAERGSDLARGLQFWHDEGHSVAMVTLTMRHHRGHGLADLWAALSDAWAAAGSRNRRVRRLRDEHGLVGYARNVEATFSELNGWHLHTHALLFLELSRERASKAADEIGMAMFAGWSARLVKAGLPEPLRDSGGLDVKLLDLSQAREAVAAYQVNATYENAAYELTGQGSKDARSGNRTPFGLLRAAVECGDASALRVWREWEQASKGKRALLWSPGLRERLALGLAEGGEAALGELLIVAEIEASVWREVCRTPSGVPLLLDAVESALTLEGVFAALSEALSEWPSGPQSSEVTL